MWWWILGCSGGESDGPEPAGAAMVVHEQRLNCVDDGAGDPRSIAVEVGESTIWQVERCGETPAGAEECLLVPSSVSRSGALVSVGCGGGGNDEYDFVFRWLEVTP